jgi:hypothetical protein
MRAVSHQATAWTSSAPPATATDILKVVDASALACILFAEP